MNKGIPRWVEGPVALAALLAAAPLLLLIGAVVVLTSRGPAVFRQRRVGRGGRLFTLYKFRSMRAQSCGPLVTARDDGRMTPVGRVLRKTKLDELPELWNVARGDMSLVGPRPEVPKYVDLANPFWKRVLEVRPGLTDPVTVRLRNEEELLSRVEGDKEQFYVKELQPLKLRGYVEYIQRRSFSGDVGVLGGTLAAIVFPGRSGGFTLRSGSTDGPAVGLQDKSVGAVSRAATQ